jgi:HD-like signal output (HDOD) protein
MTESTHPTPATLRRLTPLRDLDTDAIESLSRQLEIQHAGRGKTLLDIGDSDDSMLYLLEGRCKLIAQDGGIKIIHDADPSARAPIARLRPSRYRVVTESPVSFLRVDGALLDEDLSFEGPSMMTLENYEVDERDDLGHLDAENRLTLQIYEDLNSDRLLLPTLPNVAIRIGEAINDENSDARRVASVIETDPAISLKIVKAANSARFGGVSQVGTVTEAVARLGMQNTRILVVTFALRELFRTDSRPLERRMLALWEHSRRVASLAQVLGDKVGGFNSHEALLAGLVHDIGAIAVIAYAKDFAEVIADPPALEASIGALRSQLGGMILSRWKLPVELVTAAKEAENWYREHAGEPDYTDLVIVAQVHEGVAGDVQPAMVPALARLGIDAPELTEGLKLLNESQAEIAAAMRQLTG